VDDMNGPTPDVPVPRLAPPSSVASIMKGLREQQERLGQMLIAAVRPLWPSGLDGQVTITCRRGKFKVQYAPPHVREDGYQD
jgi:hypothetical protein